jgi:hypothetical protein
MFRGVRRRKEESGGGNYPNGNLVAGKATQTGNSTLPSGGRARNSQRFLRCVYEDAMEAAILAEERGVVGKYDGN